MVSTPTPTVGVDTGVDTVLGQGGGHTDILTDILTDQLTRLCEFHMLCGTKKGTKTSKN